ncbi:hypothetical protein GR183_12985 [Stappia sp. GBMRC 2046]|uniref:Immunity MXAN-0049 protein domain-containing protein n=1 Tax=Stappia sediminis TaxID=2692190 RepID=A0A7X3S8H1_9HYPH|nr:DUF1629 domain-containing protein [Stappia sediminis]MXN65822.1 hypothetical protein [Stappia sediminis]
MPYLVESLLLPQYTVPIKFEHDITEELKQDFQYGSDWLHVSNQNGVPIDPNIVPRRAFIQTKAKRLMDFVSLRFRYGVTEPFRQKVEELEPGIHQFIPVEIFTRDGEPVEKTYYLMNVCHRVDAIDEEKSIVTWKEGAGNEARRKCIMWGLPEGYTKETWHKNYRLVFKKELIEGMCMWIDRRYSGMFFSDELFEFVEKTKLKKLKGTKVYAE